VNLNDVNFYVEAKSDGDRPDNSHGQFMGRIDDVYVANYAFSEKEIQELMNSVLPVIWSQLKNN